MISGLPPSPQAVTRRLRKRQEGVPDAALIIIFLIFGIAVSSSATIINIPADYPAIQQGIDAGVDGDTVLVQPGTYVENINFNGHNIVLGSLFLTTGNDVYIVVTNIDGNGDTVIDVSNCNGNGLIITGFTIQYGICGIQCDNSNVNIISNWIFSNSVWGVACNNSNLLIEDNGITHNSYTEVLPSGGILADSSDVTISSNTIQENGAWGIVCRNSEAVINNNEITQNINYGTSWIAEGGGINCENTEAIIVSNYLAYNGADCNYNSDCDAFGYGISGFSLIIKNNIIRTVFANNGYWNSAYGIITGSNSFIINNIVMFVDADTTIWDYAAGIVCGSCEIVNSIVRDNEVNIANDDTQVRYSNIEGGWPGEGNIDEDPLIFWNPYDPGHLMSTDCGHPYNSPCIDAGDPDILDSLLDCSWGLGGPRSDMGAYGGGDSLITGIRNPPPSLPDRFMLLQNYPNPFNVSTTIRFILPKAQDVELVIHDLLGRQVEVLIDEYKAAGVHNITFDASALSSGVYFYRLRAGDEVETKRMVLLK